MRSPIALDAAGVSPARREIGDRDLRLAVGTTADRVPAHVRLARLAHGRVARRRVEERARGACVGEAPRAAAVVAGDERGGGVGRHAGRTERQPDADRAAELVLLEPCHDGLAVGAQRELPFAVPAEAHDREVERRVLAPRPLARDARIEPGRGGVGAAADVTADNAQARYGPT